VPFNILELHSSLLVDRSYAYAVPAEWFWKHTESLGDVPEMRFKNLLVLTPEAQLLYSSAHMILKHGSTGVLVRWLYDLDLLIRHYDGRMDWDLLFSQAKVFEWGSALDEALSQTRTSFNTPVPDRVLENLRKNTDRYRQWIVCRKRRPATHVLEELQNLEGA